jgi:cell cycle checkpoint control protein RAD9A
MCAWSVRLLEVAGHLLIVKGVVKTYKLTYESVNVMHALFDKHTAINQWSIKASILREIVEYFSPKTEQLDIYHEEDKVTFLSFTEAVVGTKNGTELCDPFRLY